MENGRYQCPKCRWVLEVKGNTVNLTNSLRGNDQKFSRSFPAHRDCELGKPLSQIDFSKLKRLPD